MLHRSTTFKFELSRDARHSFFLLLLIFGPTAAAQVQIDFLDQPAPQEAFGAILLKGGFSTESKAKLVSAVKSFYEQPLNLDLNKFPQSKNGTYLFQSMESLTAALPPKLWETSHPWTLNCFDALILAAGEKISYQLQPDDLTGPFFAIVTQTNAVSIRPCATAKDAFALTYPDWYREATATTFTEPALATRRVCLTALLFTSYVLPVETKESELSEAALRVLRARWSRYKLSFRDVEIVLVHEVNFPGRYFITSHAGVLIRGDKGFVYFEKSGGSGPFVRLDFPKRNDLLTWLAHKYQQTEPSIYSHHLVSFNETNMELLKR